MSLMSIIVKNITYPAWMFKDGRIGIYTYIRKYRSLNQLSVEELQVRQFEGLRRIIGHAFQNNSYYKNIFKRIEFVPSDLKTTDDMARLPILTKEDIRENLHEMLSFNFDPSDLIKDSTGGSTGVPMIFYRDKKCLKKRRAQELFFDRWIGYDIGEKVAYFVSGTHHPNGLSSLKSKIRNSTSERILAFSPYHLTDEYMADFLVKFRKYRPSVIKCFPNLLYIFADYLKRNNVQDLQVEAISCTGENLYAYQRRLLEDIFKCPVFEKYGTRESGVIACECSVHDGMHIFAEGVYLEFLKDGRQASSGEMGEIVVTDLFNYGMPLIRYKIGDVAVVTDRKCPCGSNLLLIDKIIGRDRDILIAQDGTPKPGYLFVEVVNKHNIPARCQFVQEDVDSLLVNIVKLNGFEERYLTIIESNCKKILGGSVNVKFIFMKDIPRESSGKFKYVYSTKSPFLKNNSN